MKREELVDKLKDHDAERVKAYLEVLDRMFINVMVSKLLDKNEVNIVMSEWEKYIKNQINYESTSRDDFLMGTPLGRLMSYKNDKIEDGEALRMSFLGCMNLATDIAKQNYIDE